MTKQQFNWWFSGLVDGEGCFGIGLSKGSYNCWFPLKLRADDLATLQIIERWLSFGYLTYEERSGRSRPCWCWRVTSKSGCLELAKIFEVAPLQSKKARHYKIWLEALNTWSSMRMARGGRGGPSPNPTDWSEMARLKDSLHFIKKYASSETIESEG